MFYLWAELQKYGKTFIDIEFFENTTKYSAIKLSKYIITNVLWEAQIFPSASFQL